MRALVPLLLALPLLAAAPATAGVCLTHDPPLVTTEVCDDGSYRSQVSGPWILTGVEFHCCGIPPDDVFTFCERESAAVSSWSGGAGAPSGGAGVVYYRSCTSYPSGEMHTSTGTHAWAGLEDSDGDGHGDTPVVILP